MTITTLNRLNQLNREFYLTVAEDFDDSRQYYWPGWAEVVPLIGEAANDRPELKVLDLGCGNGRFAQFLSEKFPHHDISYVGIDSNPQLLAKAETTLTQLSVNATFKAQDIVDLALSEQLSTVSDGQKFDVIVLFGVMHHVPSYELRLSLLKQASSMLHQDGLLIYSAWQFADFERFTKKMVSPETIGLDASELEATDYLLDWQRGAQAIRYCHHFDQKELDKLQNDLELQLITEFSADGKEGNVNRYQVLSRR